MEVTSSSQATTSLDTPPHEPTSNPATDELSHHQNTEGATGGDVGSAETSSSSGLSQFGVQSSASLATRSSVHRQHLTLDLDLTRSSGWHASGVVSTSTSAKSDIGVDNLNNAADIGSSNMPELVCYGPALPPFYPSDTSRSFSKDIRDPRAVQGSCGLSNLGNTCFMNAGLQSLMSCAPLVKFFCENYALSDNNGHTLTAHFYMLLRKLWSGQFSVVHPRKFKDFLGYYHSQFEDYRQHDCQEFLALLLDTLHEQLNTAGLLEQRLLSVDSPPPLYFAGDSTSVKDQLNCQIKEGKSPDAFLNNKDLAQQTHSSLPRQQSLEATENLKVREYNGDDASTLASGSPSSNYVVDSQRVGDHVVATVSTGGSSPTSEMSLLDSVVASPLSQVETASSSKSPERSIPDNETVAQVEYDEEEEMISSSFPSTLQRYTSRSNMDEVSSSDSGGGSVTSVRPLKRLSSSSPMSTTSSGQPSTLLLHSEDSNQSSLSAHSTDSEHNSAFKRLKIGAGDIGRNSSSNNSNYCNSALPVHKDSVSSSSDCKRLAPVNNCARENSPHVSNIVLDDPLLEISRNEGSILTSDNASTRSAAMDLTMVDKEAMPLIFNTSEQQLLSPSSLPPCLEDFYSKETKTLNTNVQVNEFLTEITTDSEKFAKVDNRNWPPGKEVNILQEAIGEDDKTDKVLIGQSLGTGSSCVKDTNLFAQSAGSEVVKPSKSVADITVLHNSLGQPSQVVLSGFPNKISPVGSEQCRDSSLSSKDENFKRLKPLEECNDCAGGVMGELKFDEEEKNVQMQAYSKFNTTSDRSNIRTDLTDKATDVPCGMEVDEVEPVESSDDEENLETDPASSHTSTAEACSSLPNCLRHQCPLSELRMATQVWREYQERNNSVVVSTFQGQFRSTVVCSECTHVSVTYEPFMYLSLPIPHAMEQQLCVTYISQHRPPVRYLLNLLKTDNVSAAKLELNKMLGRAQDAELVMAEVLDSHVSRILDNNVLLKFINTFNRKIYAFEIVLASNPSLQPLSVNEITNADRCSETGLNNDRAVSSIHDAGEICSSGLSPKCDDRTRTSLVEDNQEASCHSFDSVMVNSPSSMETVECMFSDNEGTAPQEVADDKDSSTQQDLHLSLVSAGMRSPSSITNEVIGSSPLPDGSHIASGGHSHDAGHHDRSAAITSLSSPDDAPLNRHWLYGDNREQAREQDNTIASHSEADQLPLTTQARDKEGSSVSRSINSDWLMRNRICNNLDEEDSCSMNISSSCQPEEEGDGSGNAFKEECDLSSHSFSASNSPSRFWVDEHRMPLLKREGGVEEDNEAEAGVSAETVPQTRVASSRLVAESAETDGGAVSEHTHSLYRNDLVDEEEVGDGSKKLSFSPPHSPLISASSSATHHYQQHPGQSSFSSVSSSCVAATSQCVAQGRLNNAADQVVHLDHGGTLVSSSSTSIHIQSHASNARKPQHHEQCTLSDHFDSSLNKSNQSPTSSSPKLIWRDRSTHYNDIGNKPSVLSRSCPSPQGFSGMKDDGREATLLGAVSKLTEHGFLHHRHGFRDDTYSDPGEDSSSKDAMSRTNTKRDCDAPDWPNTFPVHNFTATETQEGGFGSLSEAWKSCAICLEDLLDAELLTHVACDGVFCQNCLELSVKHTEDVSAFCCPICLQPANMCEDFVPLASASAGVRPKIRLLPLCVAYRRGLKDNTGTSILQLFGHPNIVHIPNKTSGQALYSLMDEMVSPLLPVYSVLLTDGQGLKCSRCSYSSRCTGCVISREPTEISLQPSDCLTVHVGENVADDQVTDLQLVHEDVSMAGLRSSEPTTIMDCFGAFTQSELLDEHNPWFCPRCERNQCAKKTMTVWRYPDNLIIHLKRFVYQDLASTKVDAKVVFPHEGMDVRGFLSGPSSEVLLYDLHAIVCHMGGASAGHYTCYSKHPLTRDWYYYNDENVSQQLPGESEFTSGYVLFYQRQGTEVGFDPPASLLSLDDDLIETTTSSSSACTTTHTATTTTNNKALSIPTVAESSMISSTCSGSSSNITTNISTTTTSSSTHTDIINSSNIIVNDDEDDDYDEEHRGFHDEDIEEASLTVHFGSTLPDPDVLVSSAAIDAEGVEGVGRREDTFVSGSLSPNEDHGSSSSFAEPDSTLVFF